MQEIKKKVKKKEVICHLQNYKLPAKLLPTRHMPIERSGQKQYTLY